MAFYLARILAIIAEVSITSPVIFFSIKINRTVKMYKMAIFQDILLEYNERGILMPIMMNFNFGNFEFLRIKDLDSIFPYYPLDIQSINISKKRNYEMH